MNRNVLRTLIIILTLATAIIHLPILEIRFMLEGASLMGAIPFVLNGIGYLTLLAAFMGYIPQVKGLETYIYIALISFAAITIVAWVIVANPLQPGYNDALAYVDKVIEVLLIGALIWYWRLAAKPS